MAIIWRGNMRLKRNKMMIRSALLLIFSIFLLSCRTVLSGNEKSFKLTDKDVTIHSGFQRYFDECGVSGSVVVYDNHNKKWIFSDRKVVETETLPASTFKIINLLIALETNIIQGTADIIKWPGSIDTTKYGYRPDIYRDISVKEAFELSAGWAFTEIAKKIGKENYSKYLTLAQYGNVNLSQEDPDFWNFGKFAISPVNQVQFLKNLHDETLPFSANHMKTVKQTMVSEITPEYTMRSKTGWTRESNMNTGWWVGYLESQKGVYFFATRLLQDRKLNRPDFGKCRKEITLKILKDLNYLN